VQHPSQGRVGVGVSVGAGLTATATATASALTGSALSVNAHAHALDMSFGPNTAFDPTHLWIAKELVCGGVAASIGILIGYVTNVSDGVCDDCGVLSQKEYVYVHVS
jgi:hypothetical protein